MVVYSIKDLEELSGVKAHTIRIWEKRYNIVKPKRTSTNIRYYHECDLKKLINISILNKNGIKISKIAQMSPDEITDHVASVSNITCSKDDQLDTLILSLLDLDEEKINLILDKKIERSGFVNTMLEVVYPLLDKISVLWMSGGIKGVHERFISNLIQRKCASMIESTVCCKDYSFLIYLPEGEANELSLLFLHFLIADKGFKVVNIGTEVNIEDLIEAYDVCRPRYIYTIVNNSMSKGQMKTYVNRLCEYSGDTQVLLSGIRANEIVGDLPDTVRVIPSSVEAMAFLDQINVKCS